MDEQNKNEVGTKHNVSNTNFNISKMDKVADLIFL